MKRTELRKTKIAGSSSLPHAGLDRIIDKYQKFGGQERRMQPILPKLCLSNLVKSYTKRMYSRGVVTGNPAGITRTSEVPKQEFVPVNSSCDASTGEKRRREGSPGGYNKFIKHLEEEAKRAKEKAA